MIYITACCQRERGQWAVDYTNPSFTKTFIRWLNIFRDLLNFNWWCFNKLSVKTFQPLIFNYRRCNFVYQHWGFTSIYRPCLIPLDPWLVMLYLKELDWLKTYTELNICLGQIYPCLLLIAGAYCSNSFESEIKKLV